jgi:hypothetical protein
MKDFFRNIRSKQIHFEDKKKLGILCLTILIFIASVFAFRPFFLNSSKDTKPKSMRKPIEIQVAADSIDTDKMWRNYFEEKIMENEKSFQSDIKKTQDLLNQEFEKFKQENKNEIDYTKNELDNTQKKYNDLFKDLQSLHSIKNESENIDKQISISPIFIENESYSNPEDSRLYIPETTYLTGYLMGGIAVSTSIGSASEPVPIAVRVIDRGNLPKNFSIDIKNCRILGSAYGDLSSERAVIRAETLVCSNQEKNQITTTKITGIIYGDDGMNGIRGRVIDMSSKHIKNAALGGMISGFASTLKSETEMSINPFSSFKNSDKKIEKKLFDNSVQGASSAAERIADYYIKQAENMSPILMIPGGTKVDVVFTRGVLLGSNDIQKKIVNERR